MPTDRLLPDAQGTFTDFTLIAGSTKSIALQSDDGNTSYIRNQSTTVKKDSHYVDAISAAAAAIVQVNIAIKSVRSLGTTTWSLPFCYLSSNQTSGTCVNPTGSYTLNEETDVARPPGGNWVPGDFPGGGAGAEIGVSTCNTGNNETIDCTWAYFDVEYTEVGGGFALFVAQWLPPVLAVASHGLEARELAAILWRQKTRPSSRRDFARLLEALRRRPRFLELGRAGT